MKICKSCNTAQNDSNFRCIECGEILGSPVSEKEEWKHHTELSEKMDDLTSNPYDFERGKLELILLVVNIVTFVAAIALFILGIANKNAYIIFPFAACPLTAIWCAFPKLMWKLTIWEHSIMFRNFDDTPSDYAVIINKVAFIILTVMSVLCVFYSTI